MSVIDDYLNKLEAPEKAALQRVRAIATSVAPNTEDTIGYGMPVLKYKKKYLIGFCQFKNHLSIFPGPEAIESVKDRMGDVKIAKGTIQFTLDKPLPEEVIRAVVEFRMREIDSK